MSFAPGTRFTADRTYATGRCVQFTGTVIEDYGYGLLIRDDLDGHRKHLVIDPGVLAKYGITQTITAA